MAKVFSELLGLKCTECGSNYAEVVNSRNRDNYIYRRRKCLKCGTRFTTYEFDEKTMQELTMSHRIITSINNTNPDLLSELKSTADALHRMYERL